MGDKPMGAQFYSLEMLLLGWHDGYWWEYAPALVEGLRDENNA